MIDSNKEMIFTESATHRLHKLHSDIDIQIKDYLRERKNVPGDDFIEVTASDIDELSSRVRIIRTNKTNAKQLVLYIYGITGVLVTVIGLFFDSLKKLVVEDRTRFFLILSGLMFSMVSLTLSYVLKLRDKKEKELVDFEKQKLREHEFYSRYK